MFVSSKPFFVVKKWIYFKGCEDWTRGTNEGGEQYDIGQCRISPIYHSLQLLTVENLNIKTKRKWVVWHVLSLHLGYGWALICKIKT